MDLPLVRARSSRRRERAAGGAGGAAADPRRLAAAVPVPDVLGDPPVVIVPIANHDNNQHAADENLRLANLWYGIDLMAALFTMP